MPVEAASLMTATSLRPDWNASFSAMFTWRGRRMTRTRRHASSAAGAQPMQQTGCRATAETALQSDGKAALRVPTSLSYSD